MTNCYTYLDGAHTIYLANSRGFASQYQGSFAASFVMAIGRDGDEQTQAFGLDASTSLSELNAVQIGEKAAERATRLLGGKPVPTQQVPVVLIPLSRPGCWEHWHKRLMQKRCSVDDPIWRTRWDKK